MRRASTTKTIKEATGPSLSGTSTLTYHIGIDEKQQLCFRIVLDMPEECLPDLLAERLLTDD